MSALEARVYVGVGSNLGDRSQNIENARRLLQNHPGITLKKSARNYETDPISQIPQGKFLNTVWEIQTRLDPKTLLTFLLDIENNLGRERNVKDGPRTIDLDLLFYEDAVYNETDLIVPHPRIHERKFVLEPMNELNGDWVHPVLRRKISDLLHSLSYQNENH